MSGRSIAVVGGGVSGLAAAWRLAAGGHRVTVYERRAVAGGLMRSDDIEGVIADVGVQLVSSSYQRLFQLADEVGARGLLVRAPGRDALWRGGRAHVIAYGSPASMAGSTALPTLLKLKLAARYLPFLATRCRGLDANDPAGTGGAAMDGESIAKWGRRELGDEFVELMVYPFLGAYHGGLPETTSAAFYHALARVGLDVRLYAVAGGMARLTDAVVAALVAGGHRVQTGAAVDSVRVTDDVVSVLVAGDEARHDAVVLAVPSSQARTLAIDAPSFVSWLRSASSAPSITIAVATEGPVRAGWFGLAFPRMWSPGDRVVAACVQSAKVDGLVPANRGLIVAFPSPAIAAKLASDETDSIPSLIIPALEEAFGPLQRRVIRVKAYRHPEGHTQFPPGWIRHLQTFDEQWLPERMAIAGDYMVAPTVEGAVLSGERAANRLTAIFAPR